MDTGSIKSAYRRYARHYDKIFGPIFDPGRRKAMSLMEPLPGKRVLEVGVGTGISLSYYPRDSRVVGIDISHEMLEIARRRCEREGLQQVEALVEMDAENLAFEDNSFDVVIAMYVASVVPNPDRLMEEMARVCHPDGKLLVVNHFASRNPVVRTFEKGLSPLSRYLGFRPTMDLSELPEPEGFERKGVHPTNLFGYWKLVDFNGASDSARLA